MKLTPILILLRLPGSSEPNLGFGFKTLRASLGLGEGEKKEEGSKGRRRGKASRLWDMSLSRPLWRC